MENLVPAIEIFALVTGIPYVVLEILQKRSMWILGIATGLGCAFSYAHQHLWASMGLNIYYALISVWGLCQWRKDRKRLENAYEPPSGQNQQASDSRQSCGNAVHLNRLSLRTALWSAGIFLAGTAGLIVLLRKLGGSESSLDAAITVLSAIATFWLGKSYRQHWHLWIAADTLGIFLCLKSGLYWMSALYVLYTFSALAGLWHWRRKGVCLDGGRTDEWHRTRGA